MSESCPLLDMNLREGDPVDVPSICQEQCGDLMEIASISNLGNIDDYSVNDTCNALIVFSHDTIALGSLSRASSREYHVVDMCDSDDCGQQEIQETTWQFECPYTS